MMALWMAYAVAISLVLAGIALAAEKGLDLYEKPTRWPWVAALAGSVAVPLLAYLASSGWIGGGSAELVGAGTVRTGGGEPVLPLALLGAEVTQAGTTGLAEELRSLDPWLLGGCLVASAGAACWLLVGWLRLRTERRRWRSMALDDVTVMISPDAGPAVTGFLRGVILLPAWFEELDRDLQRLVLRHEREHLTSGDHRLFAVALAAVVLFPWNPVLWWGLSRLRQAMEIDCDRRVLARGVSRATYGELLLRAGRRASGSLLSPASFAASPSLLERRIRKLASPAPDGRSSRAALAVGAAVLLGAAGGWLPAPDETVAVTEPDEAPERAERPVVIPPVPAAMRLDLRLYLDPDADSSASGSSDRELDIEAVRLARRLSFACAPYLVGTGPGDTGESDRRPDGASSRTPGTSEAPGGPGCLVVMDGRRVGPAELRDLGPGAIERINILPAEEATERYGPDGREGAFLIQTGEG